MEIIFCRCGGAEVTYGGSAPFFQPVPNHQFRTEIAVPHWCAVRRFRRWCGSAHLWSYPYLHC